MYNMKQKYHLISSIISAILTSFLLVCVILAWYTTNTQVTATGITGSVIENTPLIESIEYFEVTDITNNTITFGNRIEAGDDDTVPIGKYDPLDNPCPQILLVVNLKNESIVNVKAKSNAESYLGATILDGSGNFILTENSINSLSSIISFNMLTNVTLNDDIPTSATLDPLNIKNFADINNDSIISVIELGTMTEKSNKFYILLDYYEDSIQYIYSQNIGNPAIESDETNLKFTCDFVLSILEVA